MTAVLAGCGGGGGGATLDAQSTRLSEPAPTAFPVTSPASGASGVATRTESTNAVFSGTVVTVQFGQTTSVASFSLAREDVDGNANVNVNGTWLMNADNTAVTFTPDALDLNTRYTATLTKLGGGVTTWTFTTSAVPLTAQAPVALGSTSTFAILTKTGVTDVYQSTITGDVGASPISGAAIGLTCGEVSGTIYAADAAGPLPCALTSPSKLTTAVSDMELAYADAAGRTLPDFSDLGAGEIGGRTLTPGLYKWGTDVLISTDVTLSGGSNDVWIFQVAGQLKQASATHILLTGGAQAKNVFWQAAGAVSVGTTADFEGVVLAKTLVAVKTGASVTGRLLAQTAVTLQQNAITQPAN